MGFERGVRNCFTPRNVKNGAFDTLRRGNEVSNMTFEAFSPGGNVSNMAFETLGKGTQGLENDFLNCFTQSIVSNGAFETLHCLINCVGKAMRHFESIVRSCLTPRNV